MTALAHALVAGAMATKISNPFVAASLAVIQHFILDCIPHWDWGTNWKSRPKWLTGSLSIAETLIGLTLAYFLFMGKAQPVILGVSILFSVLPDWLESPWYIFFADSKKHEPSGGAGFWEKFTYRIYKTENAFHAKAQFPLGLYTQIAVVIFFLIILR
jgi:hypothetical protein